MSGRGECCVTMRDDGNADRSDPGEGEREYGTVAASVKRAVRNVSYRLGLYLTFDNPFHMDERKTFRLVGAECPETGEIWRFA